MAINWGGGPQNNALAYFQLGNQLGGQAREAQDARERKNALATYATNPDDPASLAGLAQKAPELAIGIGRQRQEAAARAASQAREQRRADLPLLTRLLETSTDEASYQRNRAIASEYGVDLAGAPEQFGDGSWVQGQLTTVRALQTPEGQQALSTAGKIAADMGFRPGTPEHAAKTMEVWSASEAKPYVVGGETRLYTPKLGGQGGVVGIPKLTDPSEISRLKPGDQFYDPDGVLRMVPQGGPTQPASGTFRQPVNTTATGNFRGISGETITSTYRDPGHNKRVGGVTNSFHMRRDARGNPLARDSVPPRGMSMAQYAAILRRANPDKDVINEGDHVHMEPRG